MYTAYLVAGRAARLGGLGVVAAAVELAVLVEVDQVHQQLLAHLQQGQSQLATEIYENPFIKPIFSMMTIKDFNFFRHFFEF